MSTTVRDILSQHVPGHVPILNPTFREPTYDSVNQYLGLEQYLPRDPIMSPLYTRDASDYSRLEKLYLSIK
ncbi:hypothetical protein CJF32_00009795 [Rutstroemia sp. NJR-2017a WRK4]|nr:hypothetical protein CJF32_00009795 [Rutstroemia sp. NJR-2017a WRK4]